MDWRVDVLRNLNSKLWYTRPNDPVAFKLRETITTMIEWLVNPDDTGPKKPRRSYSI